MTNCDRDECCSCHAVLFVVTGAPTTGTVSIEQHFDVEESGYARIVLFDQGDVFYLRRLPAAVGGGRFERRSDADAACGIFFVVQEQLAVAVVAGIGLFDRMLGRHLSQPGRLRAGRFRCRLAALD